jgi:hypothetical protein
MKGSIKKEMHMAATVKEQRAIELRSMNLDVVIG